LPKQFTSTPQNPISRLGRHALNPFHDPCRRNPWLHQQMHMIRHHHVSSQCVLFQLVLPFPQRSHHEIRNHRLLQPKRPVASLVQTPIKSNELLPGRRLLRRRTANESPRQRSIQPPRNKKSFPVRMPMRQVSLVISRMGSCSTDTPVCASRIPTTADLTSTVVTINLAPRRIHLTSSTGTGRSACATRRIPRSQCYTIN
jgi:hypothetical protein